MTDKVNHPSHYTSDPSGVECITITRHRSFNVGNAIKYLWRAGLKDSSPCVEDLRKAIWYIEDEIKRLEGERKKPVTVTVSVDPPHLIRPEYVVPVAEIRNCHTCRHARTLPRDMPCVSCRRDRMTPPSQWEPKP